MVLSAAATRAYAAKRDGLLAQLRPRFDADNVVATGLAVLLRLPDGAPDLTIAREILAFGMPTSSLMSMHHAHINVPMDGPRNRNIFGAFALMISDDIVRATSSRAPEAGPAASALALLAHEPGLSIRTLAIGVGLSHAGTVRLVDRLAAEGLIERRGHATDGRARSLYLTAAGRRASRKVLNARDQIIAEGLSVLSNEELVILGALSERVLRARLQGLEHAYRVCRLCCHDACDDCPVDAELRQRALDDA